MDGLAKSQAVSAAASKGVYPAMLGPDNEPNPEWIDFLQAYPDGKEAKAAIFLLRKTADIDIKIRLH
ncbi:MAG: hypothetical protein AB1547_09855 [Thermodesulfobacteriota bacterium]